MTEPLIHVDHFTDPGCPFAFCAEPQRLQVLWNFGEQVGFEDHMIVLTDNSQDLLARGLTVEKLAAAWKHLHGLHGMPLTDQQLDELPCTRPACELVIGTRRHAPERAERVLRELRKVGMAGNPIGRESTLRQAATNAGLDPDEALAWAAEPDTLAETQQAWREARDPGPATRGALHHKASPFEDGYRYSAPSWVVTAGNTGGSPVGPIEVPGFQPYAAYEVALGNLAHGLERRDPPATADEALAWAEQRDIGPLATAEVAALRGISIEQARTELEQGNASYDPAGLDGYWSLQPVASSVA